MGVFTPNIGIYIAAAGESNYADASAVGMMNIDLHDHTGGPNKGLPITSSGLANFSVTFNKLNPNVADISTGIGTNSSPGSQNQLQLLGVLRNLYALSLASGIGFISINGSTVEARVFQNSSTITWTNPDGAGNPSASLSSSFLSSGTFAPTVNTSNNDILGVAYSAQVGTYQLIGKWIMFAIELVFSNASGTGNIIIQGISLPAISGPFWISGYSAGVTLSPVQQVMNYQVVASNIEIFPNGAAGQLPSPGGVWEFNFQMTGMYQWTA